jgi:streptogramin lyase
MPVTTTQVPDINPLEDIAFDDQGYIYWNEDDTIFKAKRGEKRVPVLTGVTVRAGMRMTPSGDLYIETENALERVSPEGVRTPVLDGVFLNGLEVDPLGRLYVTEFNGTRALRYDPKTDETAVLSVDHMAKPNGITLSPNFDFLYVSSYGGSIIPTLYRIPLAPDGSAGKTENWVTGVGFGYFDGMAADECGNVYASDSGTGDVYRFSPDGKANAIVVSRSAETLHNIQWGRGKGWDENELYVVSLDKGLFVADVGVRGKKYW